MGIPCYHALTSLNERNEDPEEYIPTIYRKKAYEACYHPLIYPSNRHNLWVRIPYFDILPLPTRKAPSRPKRLRNKFGDKKRDHTLVTRKGYQITTTNVNYLAITKPLVKPILYQLRPKPDRPKPASPNKKATTRSNPISSSQTSQTQTSSSPN